MLHLLHFVTSLVTSLNLKDIYLNISLVTFVTSLGRFVTISLFSVTSLLQRLTIDHIDGRGSIHRKETKKQGHSFYIWLTAQEHPIGYQTLCMNCQWIKRYENKEYNSLGRKE
jgi:hypothetical protein